MIIKFIADKQAEVTQLYKKLYKTTAATRYNKVCADEQLTPTYITIKVNGNNLQSQKTITAAARYRLFTRKLYSCVIMRIGDI
jgi:hypothetical protein